jgi:hypothetical protein
MITTSTTRPGALGVPSAGAIAHASGSAAVEMTGRGWTPAMSEVAGSVVEAAKRRAVISPTTALGERTTLFVAAHTGRDVTDLGTSTKVQDPARSGPM